MMTTIEEAQQTNVLLFAIRYTQKEHGKLTARNQYGIRVMDRIARETGGMHIDAQEVDPQTYFSRIAEELRTSYDLGYYPQRATKDDTFRKIVVRAKKPGLTVRTRVPVIFHGDISPARSFDNERISRAARRASSCRRRASCRRAVRATRATQLRRRESAKRSGSTNIAKPAMIPNTAEIPDHTITTL